MDETALAGGCACNAVRFKVLGQPRRVGLCHCLTCRKSHGSAFNPFVVFARERVEITGEMRSWCTPTGFSLQFCPTCGSQVSGAYPAGEEVELSLGSFDAPGLFAPDYESWTIRREPWLHALPVRQNERDPAPG